MWSLYFHTSSLQHEHSDHRDQLVLHGNAHVIVEFEITHLERRSLQQRNIRLQYFLLGIRIVNQNLYIYIRHFPQTIASGQTNYDCLIIVNSQATEDVTEGVLKFFQWRSLSSTLFFLTTSAGSNVKTHPNCAPVSWIVS